jgi:hypothetical protein
MSHSKLNFGMTLHSTWLPEIQSPGPGNYDVRKDYRELVDELAREYPAKPIRELFEEIYEKFNNER